eukprot:4891220-Pleurochrysis_carterae.AAC.1
MCRNARPCRSVCKLGFAQASHRVPRFVDVANFWLGLRLKHSCDSRLLGGASSLTTLGLQRASAVRLSLERFHQQNNKRKD